MSIYYQDDHVTLYHGDYREILPTLPGARFDAVITDPPYGQTSLGWDGYPAGWTKDLAHITNSLLTFGTMRMFLDQAQDFHGWKFAQDIIWRKQRGMGVAKDRFRRSHETVAHFYQGPWTDVHKDLPKLPSTWPRRRGNKAYVSSGSREVYSMNRAGVEKDAWTDDGTRYALSVQEFPSEIKGKSVIHPTQKPIPLMEVLIRYAVPVGGTLLDPFAGSASTLVAARNTDRRAIGIEANEAFCAAAAERLEATQETP